jgi:hypothetical protein
MTEREFHSVEGRVRKLSVRGFDGTLTPLCYDRLGSAVAAREAQTVAVLMAIVKATPSRGPARYWVVALDDLERELQRVGANAFPPSKSRPSPE